MDSDTFPIAGMSPGNSYFSEENIEYLLKTLLKDYGQILIMIADIPAISTYVALGYPSVRARTDKAVRNSNNIKNRVSKVIEENNIQPDAIRVLDWENEIEENSGYKEKFSEIQKLYSENDAFRESCNQTTQAVLEKTERKIPNMEQAVSIAVHYLLAELAFLEYAPKFLDKEHVTYVYHDDWPIYEQYIAGSFDDRDRQRYLGFMRVKNPKELS